MRHSGSGKTIFHRYLFGAVLCASMLIGFVGVTEFILVRKGVISMAETHAVEISQGLSAGVLRPMIHRSRVKGTIDISTVDLIDLEDKLGGFLGPFSIARIQIIDREGETVFSTAKEMIQKPDEELDILSSALSGETVSFFEADDEIEELGPQTSANTQMVETYIPLVGQDGRVIGALETLTDVTRQLATGRRAAWIILGGLGIMVLVVFGLLTGFVRYLTQKSQSAAKKELRIKEELSRAKDFLNSVIDSLPDDFMVLNLEKEIILANRSVREKHFFDLDKDQKYCYQVTHHLDQPCSGTDDPCPIQQVLATKKPATFIHRHFCNGETQRYFEVTGSPIFDAAGNVVQIIENSRDITERLENEKKITRANSDLKAANANLKEAETRALSLVEIANQASAAKSAFLANMSHEIRTPMTAILGYTDLIAEGNIPEAESSRYLAVIRQNGEHLLSVINDILDVAKIEAGKMPLEMRPCRICDLLREVVELMRHRADSKGLHLKTECDSSIPERILTDPTRLKQALVNLVGNAIKFTASGQVKLEVVLADEQDGRSAMLQFVVSDSGLGMDQKTMSHLFQPFQQGDESTTRLYGGTGLGLVITRHIAELLGGDIKVRSEPGKGSVFTLSIVPGEVTGDAATGDSPGNLRCSSPDSSGSVDLTGIRVLFAEDGRDNQVLVQKILEKAGARVSLAVNGRIAVEMCAAGDYDVVLMDQQMPEMDGLEATRLIIQQGYKGPVIALSANAMVVDRNRSFAAGCVDHLNKPINRKAMLKTIYRYCRTGESVPG